MAFRIGQRVGDYEITQVLGIGGLGAVYKALHRISKRHDALKVALLERLDDEETADRFLREVQVLAALSHPNIAGLHHAFYHDNELIMAMEFVEGENLRQRSRRTAIELPALIRFASQVLIALDYAHKAGVVHRDIKPANIMVTTNGAVKVLDFGIATSEASNTLTATGAMVGSLSYMSPEQIQRGRATPQSDLYSLGVTLFELIAGELPLKGTTSFELMNAHLTEQPRSLVEVRPEIPLALSNAIAKALEKDQRDRFANAEDFLRAIQGLEEETAALTSIVPALPAKGSTSGGTPAGRVSSTTEQMPEALEEACRHLARFIGPIAKIVIRRLASRCNDMDQLYTEAAREIADDGDRQRFLRTRPSTRLIIK